MRRVRYRQHGGPEVLEVEQVEAPRPGPGQVSLTTEVVAASFVDTTMRSGTSPFGPGPLPGSPHGEVVGTVREVGEGVDDSLSGRRLASLVATDAYADVVLADPQWSPLVPEGVTSEQGSVLAMAAPVALLALQRGALTAGETVLVHAAAGSIGHLTVQLARLLGAARVIGTVGSAGKGDFVSRFGADGVVSLADDDWADQVRDLAGGPVDLVIDSIGGQVSATSLGLTPYFGRMVVYGAAGGSLPELRTADLLGMRTVTGFGLVQWREARPLEWRRNLALLSGWLATGELRSEVGAVVPLDDPAQAHRLLEDRSRVGRVLLRP